MFSASCVDPDIRSISVMINIMRIVDKLSVGSGDIYKSLASPSLQAIIQSETSFVKAQLEEEKLKAELIITDPAWEPELILAEKHQLFQGNISFLLINKPDIKSFKHRLGISQKLFSSKGTKGPFTEGHLLIRAIVSNIDNWDDLYAFNFGDTFDNWQLMLRRNSKVQSFICTLCDLTEEKAVISDLKTKVASASSISGWTKEKIVTDKAQRIHRQLYEDSEFYKWMQENETLKLKWANDQVYIRKPSAWHKWVAIDGYRNELNTELIKNFNLETEQKCGNANFYWGFHTKNIILNRNYKNVIISAQFDEYENFKIGVKNDGKSTLPITLIIQPADVEDDWLIRKTYSYLNIGNTKQVYDLINKIRDEVFDEKKVGSILNIIL